MESMIIISVINFFKGINLTSTVVQLSARLITEAQGISVHTSSGINILGHMK